MPYGFNEGTKTTSTGGQFLDEAGIYDARISSVAYENSKNDGSGKMVLTFRFELSDGRTFRHIEWDINEDQIRQNQASYYDKDAASEKGAPTDKQTGQVIPKNVFIQSKVDKEYEDQGARVKHILEAYTTPSPISATSYESYARAVAQAFKGIDTTEYKPLLVVYNTKDYASLPKWTPFFGVDKSVLEKKAVKSKMVKQQPPTEGGAQSSGTTEEF